MESYRIIYSHQCIQNREIFSKEKAWINFVFYKSSGFYPSQKFDINVFVIIYSTIKVLFQFDNVFISTIVFLFNL